MYERSDNTVDLFSLVLSNMEVGLWWHQSIQIQCPWEEKRELNSELQIISSNLGIEYITKSNYQSSKRFGLFIFGQFDNRTLQVLRELREELYSVSM